MYDSRSINARPCREADAGNTPIWQFSVRSAVPEYCRSDALMLVSG